MRRIGLLPLVFSALSLAGCGGVSSPSQNQTQTFTGTVMPGGTGPVHQFNVSRNGEMSVRMTSVTPTASSILGTLVSQSLNGTCNVALGNEPFTGLNRDVLQLPVQKATYCVQLYESNVSRLTQAQTYTIQVSYP